VELGRFREGLAALDDAARQNPDLGMVWHEAGYAAWRLGELSRALMALDRAFALEPHGGTLHLRGKVLRQAGRYLAAEVSFEGAAQAAEFAIQREAAEQEIRITRRYAAFHGSKPDTLPPLRRWFADTGSAPLTGHTGDPATDEQIVEAFACLTRDLEWHFSVLVALDTWEGWHNLAARLDVSVTTALPPDPNAIPLVAVRDPTDRPLWEIQARAPAERGRGASLALRQPAGLTPADVVGYLAEVPLHGVDLPFATEAVQHPEASLHGRVLG
jgi:tetratricopeptide (TPR) repeat protein